MAKGCLGHAVHGVGDRLLPAKLSLPEGALAITEVNAMNSRGRIKGVAADSVIPFCFRKKMAFLRKTNTINNEGGIIRNEERLL